MKFVFFATIALVWFSTCQSDVLETDDTDTVKNDTQDYVETMSNLEKKLLLQQTYDIESRPVKDPKTSLKVRFHFAVYHIEEVNELEQTMTVHGYLYLQWRDEFLTWNPKEFSNQNQIDLPIWRICAKYRRPDVNLYNSASGKDDWHVSWRYPARVYSDGRVTFWPPVTFRVTCFFDFANFPYDTHTCPIVLGSWKYYMEQVEYMWSTTQPRKRLAYRSDKIHVAGWELVNISSTRYFWGPYGRSNTTTNVSSLHWIELISFVKLKRHAPYFTTLFVLPNAVAGAFTVLSMFLQSSEQAIFVLLIDLVLQGILSRALVLKLPAASSSTPKIVHFYGFNLSMTFLGIIFIIIRIRLMQLNCTVPERLLILPQFYDKLKCFICSTFYLGNTVKGMQQLKNEDDTENQEVNSETILKDTSGQDWKIITDFYNGILVFIYSILYVVLSTVLLS